MRDQLRAGAAIYNEGFYHAAHDAWEARWLECEDGTDDEQLLHGLIQATAAVFHAHECNWEGAVGVAESAQSYLAGLPDDYRGVDLPPMRAMLATFASDPEVLERRAPVRLALESDQPRLADLNIDQTTIAAPILAAEWGYDPEPVEQACTYARTDLEAGDDDSRFITLAFDFVRKADARGIIYQRLTSHVDRRQAREEDVQGLF
ncbi:DUF309 domain-containing protein [Natronolimnobius sp. AArcel1]|uniref:DUF309 domain-containing protein n=1 Tax=Natronolimnobius sp. AArcel1 TaxID=1679093 RepID=UPI0013EE2310|nr:DUF309 domain-containing protein [Natronolimnobius sp. AArcel1]NGM70235.1 DUF309 domain-containing protein [Natronolimnobius sp. AArcel1]